MLKKSRMAAYIRVSTDMSDQEKSYETQGKYFQRLLEQNTKWIPAGSYPDYDITGTSCKKRTGFKRILRHCEKGKIEPIICKSISRFARNTSGFMTALNVLRESNVTILFGKEGLDTENPTSSFILTTLAAIAQEELKDDYEYRDKAIKWTKSLPSGKTGTVEFLNGMTDTYVKAFYIPLLLRRSEDDVAYIDAYTDLYLFHLMAEE